MWNGNWIVIAKAIIKITGASLAFIWKKPIPTIVTSITYHKLTLSCCKVWKTVLSKLPIVPSNIVSFMD
tara:strand:- start:111 stop:317 length:207 start_codon:yes stop_codon:yes gene_type:complete